MFDNFFCFLFIEKPVLHRNVFFSTLKPVAVGFYKEKAREETFSFFNIYSEHHLNIIYMSVWNLECLPQYLHSLVDLSIELRQFERGEGLEVYTQLNRGIWLYFKIKIHFHALFPKVDLNIHGAWSFTGVQIQELEIPRTNVLAPNVDRQVYGTVIKM